MAYYAYNRVLVDTDSEFDAQAGSTTPPPHTQVTDYLRRKASVTEAFGTTPTLFSASDAVNDVMSRASGLRALVGERLYQRARAETDLAETIAEIAGGFTEIGRSTNRLIKSYKYLRKGQFSKSFRALGANGSKLHNSADAYLAWQFGIKPTIQSISDSVEFLQNHPAISQVRASGSDNVSEDDVSYTSWGTRKIFIKKDHRLRCRAGMNVRLINPNLALADSYGFLNPAKLGWELIPMSFLVDYFVPVGKFLGAFSPLYGREVSQPYISVVAKGTYSRELIDVTRGTTVNYWSAKTFGLRRDRGVREHYAPSDILRLKLPDKRAADTTVALAVKTFRK